MTYYQQRKIYKQHNAYKKAMEIVTTFQDNLRDNINTYAIVDNPKLDINGRVVLLLEIEGIASNGFVIPEINAKIQTVSESKTSPHVRFADRTRKISIYDLELYKEKETREIKEVKGVNNKLVFIPKRINFRMKKGNYYTDVLWEDGTVTVVKLKDGEDFDEYAAFCAALAKKIFGSTNAVNDIVKKTACYPLTKAQKKSVGRMKKAIDSAK